MPNSLAAFVLLFAATTAPSAFAQPPPVAPPPSGGDVTLSLRLPQGTTTADLEANLGGIPLEVREITPPRPVPVVIYLDATLATEGRLEAAARALQTLSARLPRLGPVEVVLADPAPETLLPPSTDSEAIQGALRSGSSQAAGTWGVSDLRVSFRQETDTAAPSPTARETAAQQEAELVSQAVSRWVEALLARESEGGGIVLWLTGPFDADPRPAYGLPPTPGDLAEQLDLWGRDLATAGWTVVPLTWSVRDPAVPAGDGPGRLALATGGQEVNAAKPLETLLTELAARQRVVLRVPQTTPDAAPLSLRSRTKGELPGPRWLATNLPPAVALARARRLLDDPSAPVGSLRLAAALLATPALPAGATEQAEGLVTIEARAAFGAAAPATVRVTTVLRPIEGESLEVTSEAPVDPRVPWYLRQELPLGEDVESAAVVIEDLATGRWGAAVAQWSEVSIAPAPTLPGASAAPGAAPSTPLPPVLTPTLAPSAGLAPAPSRGVAAAPSGGRAILLLPPAKRPLAGRTRFQTITSSPDIARVDFLLDGQPAGSDDRAPFSVTLDLATPARVQEVRAVAYSAGGNLLGEHVLSINGAPPTFEVTITDLTGDPSSGGMDVAAKIAVPIGARLDRVEVYRNEERVARLTAAPFKARVPTPAPLRPGDYVRVVATLADGTSLEDVRLLDGRGAGARIEVNLVQAFVVATDRKGTPVADLTAADFVLTLDGKPQTLESFQLATDVPLALGVVIDSSESMWPLMEDTRRAAARFVLDTVRSGDKAFLVDFDDHPRLIQGLTGDTRTLLSRFRQLEPGGATALYDSMLFSLLQFESSGTRRALVVLTDGQDYGSRASPKQVIDHGRSLAVPIYVLSLAGLNAPGRAAREVQVEGVCRHTGGRMIYLDRLEELGEAYAGIHRELRSQYVLAFSTPEPLTPAEIEEIEVKTKRPGVSVRVAVGQP